MAGPDIKAVDAPPYPIWGFGPPSSEPDTKKLDALLASLNGSAERFQTLWFSFLGLTLYLAIAALATTHRNLLLGEPQVLPILNIKVELLPFYVIAPLLYLVFHFYLLMMLALLARTAAEFDNQVRATLPGESERERYRAQVGNALFLQLLVGMKGERTGVNALLMGLIALITIVLAPLATLILMQMMFLPYHHLRITWWHRAVVVADLVLIMVMTYRCFFPRGIRKAPVVLGTLRRKPRWATAMAFCALLAVVLAPLVDWLSFRQGRWAGEPRPYALAEWTQWMEGNKPQLPDNNPDYAATEKGVVFGWFPDRLKLASETIVGKEKWEKIKEESASRKGAKTTPDESDFVPTIKLDDRDLQAADLSGADLRGVSLNAAAIQGATLVATRLDEARLICEGPDRSKICTQLRGANLARAQLTGADLDGARLQGADLSEARLQGAVLKETRLQGARLVDAELQGADLEDARLQSARLLHAHLQGTNLLSAELQGSNLVGAQLQGAELEGAQFQGAYLWQAQLQGADLASAGLQGADLSNADLSDAEFDKTSVFRTNVADESLATAAVNTSWANQPSSADIETWIFSATQLALASEKKEVTAGFNRLKIQFQTDGQDRMDDAKWKKQQTLSDRTDPKGAHHRQLLEKLLAKLACDATGAPYIARGLISNLRLDALGDRLASVRILMEEGRKASEKCPGVAGFTDDDWRRLEALTPD